MDNDSKKQQESISEIIDEMIETVEEETEIIEFSEEESSEEESSEEESSEEESSEDEYEDTPYGVMGVSDEGDEDDIGFYATLQEARKVAREEFNRWGYASVIVFNALGYNPEYGNCGTVPVLHEYAREQTKQT